jgi:hypothetical protein
VPIPVSDYILGESNPLGWSVVGRVMPVFPIAVLLAIAREFDDREQLGVLNERLQ